jgi:hypothetical protein
MSAAETLEPHVLARLLLDAAPHIDLIERVAPYLPTLRPILPMLDKWSAVETDLMWAQSAPEHLKATAHQAVFLLLAKNHGGSAGLWGAIGHEMQQRRPQKTAQPATPKRPKHPNSGVRKIVRTEEEISAMRSNLLKCEQVITKSGHSHTALSNALGVQCEVKASPNTLSSIKTGWFLKQMDLGKWPELSMKILEEIIAGLELLENQGGIGE